MIFLNICTYFGLKKQKLNDIIAVVKRVDRNKILNILNETDEDIKFTIEIENNKHIPYLDMLLHNESTHIITDWYSKPTASNRMLNWLSKHPVIMKRNVGFAFVSRVLTLSHNNFYEKH